MAGTFSYGMGQYRFTKDYPYITSLSIDKEKDIEYYITESESKVKYRDILVTLPVVGEKENETPIVQYGQTYYLKLSVPRNRQYTMTLNLKLCPANTDHEPVIDRFQQINRIEVPSIPDGNVYSEVVLYQNPTTEKTEVGLIDVEHDDTKDYSNTHNKGELYKVKNAEENIEYQYFSKDNKFIKVENFNAVNLIRSWEVIKETEDIVTYKFVFSPKYNLAEGYRYLLIETDRNNLWTNDIQYIDSSSGVTYNGTYLDLDLVEAELYVVNNLLAGGAAGTSQIKSGTNTLTHIAVWGHPEQIIAINGEEIKIGRTGFYEIKDFTISSLGVVVENYDVDRFTIDYEYKVSR